MAHDVARFVQHEQPVVFKENPSAKLVRRDLPHRALRANRTRPRANRSGMIDPAHAVTSAGWTLPTPSARREILITALGICPNATAVGTKIFLVELGSHSRKRPYA